MNVYTEENKRQVLSRAIARIKEYDTLKEHVGSSGCYICDMIPHDYSQSIRCPQCPFYSEKDTIFGCDAGRKMRAIGGTQEEINNWQQQLIIRTKRWCKKYYPDKTRGKVWK